MDANKSSLTSDQRVVRAVVRSSVALLIFLCGRGWQVRECYEVADMFVARLETDFQESRQ